MKNAMHFDLLVGLAAAISIGLASTGHAGSGNDGPNVLKPYYYQPPGGPLNATDRQQLMVYRQQLELQQQSLQLQQDRGMSALTFPQPAFQRPVNPATTSSELLRTQSELDRVNRLLNPAPGGGSVAPSPPAGPAPLPIVPMGMGSQFVITVH
jgi:hypothetical protein